MAQGCGDSSFDFLCSKLYYPVDTTVENKPQIPVTWNVRCSPNALAGLVFEESQSRDVSSGASSSESATSGLQVCIWVLIAGLAVLRISRNAVSAGLSVDLSQ